MPLPTKPCKYCGSLKHWPFQCWKSPKSKALTKTAPAAAKPLKKHGKAYDRWITTRRQWFIDNATDSYECYLCGKYLEPHETTLDHVIPRSRAPHLRYVMSNLRPCCWQCNSEKGSKVY